MPVWVSSTVGSLSTSAWRSVGSRRRPRRRCASHVRFGRTGPDSLHHQNRDGATARPPVDIEVLLQQGGELRLGAPSDEGFDEGAALEDQQGGDAGDVEVLGGARVFVHVELADDVAAIGFGGELVDDRRDRSARSAPWGPGVDQEGLVAAMRITWSNVASVTVTGLPSASSDTRVGCHAVGRRGAALAALGLHRRGPLSLIRFFVPHLGHWTIVGMIEHPGLSCPAGE